MVGCEVVRGPKTSRWQQMGVWNAQGETSIFRLFCLALIQTKPRKGIARFKPNALSCGQSRIFPLAKPAGSVLDSFDALNLNLDETRLTFRLLSLFCFCHRSGS
ncbi:MAG: hypothetical protein HC767_04090 [Akkermansiaceae bacterium]|nr:hypothetical protein [Akkermansiaceae bacterium]